LEIWKKNYWPPEAHFRCRDESALLIKRATFVRNVKYEIVDPLILRPSDDLSD
jgi:hypothetical protein